MRILLTFSCLLILYDGTGQKKNVFDCPVQKATTHLYAIDGFVKPRAFMGIDTGNMIVFKFSRGFDCCGGNHCLAEGKLFWTIEKGETSFNIKVQRKDSLSALMTYYMLGWNKDNYILTSAEGEVRGQLIKDKWLIKGKMRLYLMNLNGEPDKVIEEFLDGEYIRWKKSRKLKHSRRFYSFD